MKFRRINVPSPVIERSQSVSSPPRELAYRNFRHSIIKEISPPFSASAWKAGIKGDDEAISVKSSAGFVAFDAFVVDRVHILLFLSTLWWRVSLFEASNYFPRWIDSWSRKRENERVGSTLFFSFFFFFHLFSLATLGMEKVNAQSRHRYISWARSYLTMRELLLLAYSRSKCKLTLKLSFARKKTLIIELIKRSITPERGSLFNVLMN